MYDINNWNCKFADFNDIYCPDCGAALEYNAFLHMFRCPDCKQVIDEDDIWEFIEEPDSEVPPCCAACGGPYPQCTTSCKIFDD